MQNRQADEDMKRGQDRPGVCDCNEKMQHDTYASDMAPYATWHSITWCQYAKWPGTADEPNLPVTTWATSNVGFKYRCARTIRAGPMYAQERKGMRCQDMSSPGLPGRGNTLGKMHTEIAHGDLGNHIPKKVSRYVGERPPLSVFNASLFVGLVFA